MGLTGRRGPSRSRATQRWIVVGGRRRADDTPSHAPPYKFWPRSPSARSSDYCRSSPPPSDSDSASPLGRTVLLDEHTLCSPSNGQRTPFTITAPEVQSQQKCNFCTSHTSAHLASQQKITSCAACILRPISQKRRDSARPLSRYLNKSALWVRLFAYRSSSALFSIAPITENIRQNI